MIIQASGGAVEIRSDPAADRWNGSRTGVSFTNINVNIEPIPDTALNHINIVAYPGALIYELAPEGFVATAYADTEHYRLTRAFLQDPEGNYVQLDQRA